MSDTSLKSQRIPALRDIYVSMGFLFIFLVFIMSVLIVPAEERLGLIVLLIPVIVFLGWLYFGTYYIFEETRLVCQSGPFREKIPYERIKALRLCENMMSSMALARKRIEIKQHGKGYVTGTTYISPVDRESFYEELKRRCPNLENQTA